MAIAVHIKKNADVTVENPECRNHLLHNYSNKFKEIVTDRRYDVKDSGIY